MQAPVIHIQHLSIHLPSPGAPLDPMFAPASSAQQAATAPRFQFSHDGSVVTDHKTGLQWAANESPKKLNFTAAEKLCTDLRLGGFSDWRLPDIAELESIRDLTRHNPCIDTAFFQSHSGWVWSRTPCAWSSAHAWLVHFYNGYVSGDLRDDTAFVRAVRGVSPAGQ